VGRWIRRDLPPYCWASAQGTGREGDLKGARHLGLCLCTRPRHLGRKSFLLARLISPAEVGRGGGETAVGIRTITSKSDNTEKATHNDMGTEV